MIVNYPVRRRIVSLVMIIGNLGLVGVFATVVASLVQTDGEVDAVMQQLAWLLAGLAVLWFLMLNKTADRIMCRVISSALNATTQLGRRRYNRVLQVGNGLSVCEHPLDMTMDHNTLDSLGLRLIAVRDRDGNVHTTDDAFVVPDAGGWLIAYGDDTAHDALAASD